MTSRNGQGGKSVIYIRIAEVVINIIMRIHPCNYCIKKMEIEEVHDDMIVSTSEEQMLPISNKREKFDDHDEGVNDEVMQIVEKKQKSCAP